MTPSSPALPKERPKFARFRLERLATGQCRARVSLAWRTRGEVTGEATAMTSASGELRCAALACLDALTRGVPEPAFELLGVKAIRAFDANVVVVSLTARGESGGPRLVGSYLAGDNLPRAAALAVLNAANRIVTRGVAR